MVRGEIKYDTPFLSTCYHPAFSKSFPGSSWVVVREYLVTNEPYIHASFYKEQLVKICCDYFLLPYVYIYRDTDKSTYRVCGIKPIIKLFNLLLKSVIPT